MIINFLESLRSQIEGAKTGVLDIKVVKTIEDYNYRIGYLTGLQKALSLFAERNKEDYLSDD